MYADAFTELEGDFASSPPPLHIDLYHARLLIRSHKPAIIRAALAAARRIARQHGVAVLRHEAYQRAALRQGFYALYLSRHPMPTDPARAATYRRELIRVGQRAEGELMAMLGSFRSLVLRTLFKLATKGLGETEADGYARPNRHRKTQTRYRARQAKRRLTQNRARLRRSPLRPVRPSQKQIVRYMPMIPRPPASLDPAGRFVQDIRLSLWRNYPRYAPIAAQIANGMAQSPTGNPGPTLFAGAVTQILVQNRLIRQSDRQACFAFFKQLWSIPAPRLFVLAVAAAAVLSLSYRKSVSREGHFETRPMRHAVPLSGGAAYSAASAEAEALAQFEMAAL